jgi:hypothetical protein
MVLKGFLFFYGNWESRTVQSLPCPSLKIVIFFKVAAYDGVGTRKLPYNPYQFFKLRPILHEAGTGPGAAGNGEDLP